jgi:hypothetical protein
VERVVVTAIERDGTEHILAEAGAVGHQRIIRFDPVSAIAVRLDFSGLRGAVVLRGFAAVAAAAPSR